MCTESSNQQRMWKDLLGETLRAFLARCILFLFFCEMGEKKYTPPANFRYGWKPIWKTVSVIVKCFSKQTEQKAMRGAKRLALLNSKKCVARSWKRLQCLPSEWVYAHDFCSPCTLYSNLYLWEMRKWKPYQTGVVDSKFLFAPLVHDKRYWRSRTWVHFCTPCLTEWEVSLSKIQLWWTFLPYDNFLEH